MAERNEEYERLIEELSKINLDKERSIGIVGFQRTLDERFAEEAGDDGEYEVNHNYHHTFDAPRGNAFDSPYRENNSLISYDVNEDPINVKITDSDFDDQHISLIRSLRNERFKVRITNALEDVVEPFFLHLREENETTNELEDGRHRETFLKLDEISDRIGNMGKEISESFLRSSFLTWKQFTKHPVMESFRLLNKFLLSPVFTGAMGVLFGFKSKKNESDRIIDAIKEQTEFLATGEVDRRQSFGQRLKSSGVLGTIVKSAGEGVAGLFGISRDKFEQDEKKRAAGERTTGIQSKLASTFFKDTSIVRSPFGIKPKTKEDTSEEELDDAQEKMGPAVGSAKDATVRGFGSAKDWIKDDSRSFGEKLKDTVSTLKEKVKRKKVEDEVVGESIQEQVKRYVVEGDILVEQSESTDLVEIVSNIYNETSLIRKTSENMNNTINGMVNPLTNVPLLGAPLQAEVGSGIVTQPNEEIQEVRFLLEGAFKEVNDKLSEANHFRYESFDAQFMQNQEHGLTLKEMMEANAAILEHSELHDETLSSILKVNKHQLREDKKVNRNLFLQRMVSIVGIVKDSMFKLLDLGLKAVVAIGGIGGVTAAILKRFLPGGRGGKGGALAAAGGVGAAATAGTLAANRKDSRDDDNESKKRSSGKGSLIKGAGIGGLVAAGTSIGSSMLDIDPDSRLGALLDIASSTAGGAGMGAMVGGAAGLIGGPLAVITAPIGAAIGGVTGAVLGLKDNFDTLVHGNRNIVASIEDEEQQESETVGILGTISQKFDSLVERFKHPPGRTTQPEKPDYVFDNEEDMFKSIIHKVEQEMRAEGTSQQEPTARESIAQQYRFEIPKVSMWDELSKKLNEQISIVSVFFRNEILEPLRESFSYLVSKAQEVQAVVTPMIDGLGKNIKEFADSHNLNKEGLVEKFPKIFEAISNIKSFTLDNIKEIPQKLPDLGIDLKGISERVSGSVSSLLDKKFNQAFTHMDRGREVASQAGVEAIRFGQEAANTIGDNVLKNVMDSMKQNSDKQLEMTSQEIQLFKDMKQALSAIVKNTVPRQQEQVSLGGFDSGTIDSVRGN